MKPRLNGRPGAPVGLVRLCLLLLAVVAALLPRPALGFLLPGPVPTRPRSLPARRRQGVVLQCAAPQGNGAEGDNPQQRLDLELNTPPMPLGGESQYEYVSEYADQQAEMEYLADDELLQKYRDDMQNSNDQWQLNLFLKAQAGTWSGVWSEYTPVPNGGANGETVFRMTNIYKGRQECVGDYDARTVRWWDLTLLHAADGGPLEPVVVAEKEMLPTSFRGTLGAMTADNVFSCSRVWPQDGGGGGEMFDAEVWIRQGEYRTRVTFVYESAAPDAAFEVHKIVVKKERLGKQGPTAEEPELFGSSGRGIYDPSARVPGSWDLSLHGGLSLVFPPTLPRGDKGAVIVDWIAGSMRFQADRLFDLPDGTLASLEVTQIGSDDSLLFTIPETESVGTAPVPVVQPPSET